ncbi:hypothetical protein L1049_006127 [Liquidambar formosana]|uniref:RING-type E3 ubiquitin transferase n=1 Tax=Liquidambar formosana TaxID=63359 RepID=A0AAP0WQL9_LIQFO
MASEADMSETPLIERLITSRNRDLSSFIPFIFGVTNLTPGRDRQDPDEETPETPTPRDRIILINPFTQGMIVIEGTSSLESLLREISSKGGQPPASKASIEAMPEVEITEESGECVICLEEWEIGGVAKEMPCNHRFHGECIEKWLGIHGSCPVCRYKMPFDEEDVGKKRDDGGVGGGGDDEEGRVRRRVEREIWVSFSFNSSSRRGDSNQTPSSDPNDSSSSPRFDHEIES